MKPARSSTKAEKTEQGAPKLTVRDVLEAVKNWSSDDLRKLASKVTELAEATERREREQPADDKRGADLDKRMGLGSRASGIVNSHRRFGFGVGVDLGDAALEAHRRRYFPTGGAR